LRPVGDDEWDRLLDAQSAATPFHTAAFLRSTSVGLGRDLKLLAATVDGADVGGVPLLIRRQGPLRSMNWYPQLRIGPVMAPEWQPQAMSQTRRFAGGLTARERHLSSARIPATSLAEDWTIESYDTFVVELAGRSEDDLMAGVIRTAKQNLRRCARLLTADEARLEEIAELLPRWSAEAFARTGEIAPFAPGVVSDVLAGMESRWPMRHGAIRLDGKAISIYAVLARGDRAFAWQMASDPEHRNLTPGLAAYWHTIDWARRQGCLSVDLAGAPSPGIERVKRALGATPEPVYVYSRVSRAARIAADAARRVTAAVARSRGGSASPSPEPGAAPVAGPIE
jgi:CelD/BcsL family acetyltransferase involved in cellulose biosynthesis